MKKPYRLFVLPKVKRAVYEYKMINDGDVIAVGLSGGKDSVALLHLLVHLRKKIPVDFKFKAVFVHMGWVVDFSPVKEYCQSGGIEFHVKETEIGKIIFELRDERSPCALCANLRRGALNEAALELGCNKVALGHHLDDVMETFFMSLFYTGQMRTFQPRTYLDRTGLTVIRPMIYLTRNIVKKLVREEKLPHFENPCPVDGKTKREEAKEIANYLSRYYPNIRGNFLNGLKSLDPRNLWGIKGKI